MVLMVRYYVMYIIYIIVKYKKMVLIKIIIICMIFDF